MESYALAFKAEFLRTVNEALPEALISVKKTLSTYRHKSRDKLLAMLTLTESESAPVDLLAHPVEIDSDVARATTKRIELIMRIQSPCK
jgi:hypothetical protein